MSKKRCIATILLKDGIVVQSYGFKKYLPIGDPLIICEALNRWGADEICLLDIDASRNGGCISPKLVESISKKVFVPLTVGGGVSSVKQVRELIAHGADKVSLCTNVINNKDLIRDVAETFGSQCIVACLDVIIEGNEWRCATHSASKVIDVAPFELARLLEKQGVGEIIVHFVDRDGQQLGYDIEFIRTLLDVVSLPIIALGGYGQPSHALQLFELQGVACAIGNALFFNEHSISVVKGYLAQNKVNVRNESFAEYAESEIMELGRVSISYDLKGGTR